MKSLNVVFDFKDILILEKFPVVWNEKSLLLPLDIATRSEIFDIFLTFVKECSKKDLLNKSILVHVYKVIDVARVE